MLSVTRLSGLSSKQNTGSHALGYYAFIVHRPWYLLSIKLIQNITWFLDQMVSVAGCHSEASER